MQRCSAGDGVLEVGDARDPSCTIQRDAKQVDAPDHILEFRMGDEKRLNRCHEPPLLCWRYRLFGLDQATSSHLDLDKDKGFPLLHDQVEFTGWATPLFSQAGVSICFELPAGEPLARVAQALPHCAHYEVSPHVATGEKHRRWWMLGPCSARRALCSGEQ